MNLYLLKALPAQLPLGTCWGRVSVPPALPNAETLQKAVFSLPARINALYTSPHPTAVALADAIKAETPTLPTYSVSNHLLELDYGLWEKKPWDKLSHAQLQHWTSNVFKNAPPEGETYLQVKQRAMAFLTELQATFETDDNVVVISHSAPLQILLHLLINIDENHILQFEFMPLKFTLLRLNSNTAKMIHFNA